MQTLKGFRDFIGYDAQKRMWLIDMIRQVFSAYGFEPLETPVLEYASLLKGKYGDEAEKLIYAFEDRGGREVAMRYDQTVPTARVVAQYQNTLTFPYKRYQIQPVWRADKPQKGRYREFFQCDADIIGSKSSVADAEILAVYYAIYKAIGLNSIQILVNDRQQLIELVKSAGAKDNQVLPVIQTIDKIKKISQKDLIDELITKGLLNEQAETLLNKLKNTQPSENLSEIVNQAVLLGVPRDVMVFEPSLARGLDYYTGLIFEGLVPEYTVGSVGGGGRYDNLINSLVGVDMPAVGFGLGFDRTLEAAEELGLLPAFSDKRVLVSVFSPEFTDKSLELTTLLRSNGVTAECYPEANQKLEKQIKYALKKNFGYMCILGQNELTKNSVTVKNLNENSQKEVARDQLISFLS